MQGKRLSPAVGGYDSENPVTLYPEENPYGENGQFRTIEINYQMNIQYLIQK
ncbi:hypothetical protein [Mesonia sp. K4-1]|uniref:hypothetical protein n=1 Tax=Mesonia sp. K4-1 TaxID=2602760 RepID=UPI001650626F|nr:hypothetical protein [Mesonia sp. K4-1]